MCRVGRPSRPLEGKTNRDHWHVTGNGPARCHTTNSSLSLSSCPPPSFVVIPLKTQRQKNLPSFLPAHLLCSYSFFSETLREFLVHQLSGWETLCVPYCSRLHTQAAMLQWRWTTEYLETLSPLILLKNTKLPPWPFCSCTHTHFIDIWLRLRYVKCLRHRQRAGVTLCQCYQTKVCINPAVWGVFTSTGSFRASGRSGEFGSGFLRTLGFLSCVSVGSSQVNISKWHD